MFEKIVLRRSIHGPALTAGELAEGLLYYQNVHIIVDYGTLAGLASQLDIPILLGLLARRGVSATYVDEFPGVQTHPTPSGPLYSLGAVRFVGSRETGPLKSRKKRIQLAFERFGRCSKKDAKRHAERFRRMVSFRNLSDDSYIPGGAIKLAQSDLLEADYLLAAAEIEARGLLQGRPLPDDFYFRAQMAGDNFTIASNLDFDEITRVRAAIDPNAGTYSPAHISAGILNATIGSVLAGHYGGDFYTSDTESKILELRYGRLLKRAAINRESIKQFESIVFGESPRIADTINSRSRSFEEFLEVLSEADRFKEWLRLQPPHASVAAQYVNDISSIGWLDTLPAKAIRYVLGTIAGAIEPTGGTLLSAIDAFILDKLVGGWRPNQFVQGQLRPFVEETDLDE